MLLQKVRHVPYLLIDHDPAIFGRVVAGDLFNGQEPFCHCNVSIAALAITRTEKNIKRNSRPGNRMH